MTILLIEIFIGPTGQRGYRATVHSVLYNNNVHIVTTFYDDEERRAVKKHRLLRGLLLANIVRRGVYARAQVAVFL